MLELAVVEHTHKYVCVLEFAVMNVCVCVSCVFRVFAWVWICVISVCMGVCSSVRGTRTQVHQFWSVLG